MKITKLEDAPKVPSDLKGYIMHSDPRIELIHLTVKPGEIIENHANPLDVVVFPLSGKAVFTVDNEATFLKPCMSVFVPKGAQRGFDNAGSDDFKVLILKILLEV
jgi:quercetin dioxygenase-like cupin family protein